MAIINPLPNTIANGDPLDAVPVMADFAQIVTDVNNNAAGVNVLNTFTQPQNVANAILPSQAVNLGQLTAMVRAYAATGTLFDFAGPTIPTNSLECLGQAVSRTTYANLFAVIGTYWGGGDGVTTFNVPNLSRRSTIGRGGAGTGTVGNALANAGGEENHTISSSEMSYHTHGVSDPGHNHYINQPGHTHGVSDPTHTHGVSDPGHAHVAYNTMNASGGTTASGFGYNVYTPTNTGTSAVGTGIGIYGAYTGISLGYSVTGDHADAALTGISLTSAGGNVGHNTYHPVAVVAKCIRI